MTPVEIENMVFTKKDEFPKVVTGYIRESQKGKDKEGKTEWKSGYMNVKIVGKAKTKLDGYPDSKKYKMMMVKASFVVGWKKSVELLITDFQACKIVDSGKVAATRQTVKRVTSTTSAAELEADLLSTFEDPSLLEVDKGDVANFLDDVDDEFMGDDFDEFMD